METLKFLYMKWIKRKCPHICRWCKFNENKYIDRINFIDEFNK